jgi:multiple sugar transport system permease protein
MRKENLANQARLRPVDVVFNVMLYCLAAAMIFPFIWLVSTSFKLPQHVLAWPPSILPQVFTLSNYEAVFTKVDMFRYFFNTIRFTLVSTACIVFTSALAGYVFAKYRFPLKETMFYTIIATMMVPFQCYMVPLYMMMVKLRAVDTYWGLQLPYLIQAIGTFFMRQNFESLPDEYLESARIEGASEWKIFFKIALPSFRSALGGLSIFIVSLTWGNLIWPEMDGGGALMNQGIHGVDLLRYLMGPVKSVTAHARTLARKIEVEDTAVAILEFQNGALGVIEATTSVYPGSTRRLEINGDRGTVILEENSIVRWDIHGQTPPPDILAEHSPGDTSSNPGAFGVEGHLYQSADMVDAILNDRRPVVDGKEGRNALEIILAVYRSSSAGELVLL